MLTFFGHREDFKIKLYREVFDLVYYSNGAFTHDEVYSMPTVNRKFYIKLLSDILKKNEEHIKDINSQYSKINNILKKK